jgi:tetratricopeptide (TPR) repeat protein
MNDVDQGSRTTSAPSTWTPTTCPRSRRSSASTAIATTAELAVVLSAKAKGAQGARGDRGGPSCARAGSTRPRSAPTRPRRSTARCSSSTPPTCSRCAASSASTGRSSSGPTSCASSRCSSTSSRRSASASRCSPRSPRSRRSSSSSRISRRCARAGRRDRPEHEVALEGLERCYRRLRQWHDLINAYDRHINATHDRQKKIELYGATSPRSTRTSRRTSIARSTRTSTSSTSTTATCPALEALSKLYEKQAIRPRHRLHDARRRPHGRRQAARRDVLPHRAQLDEKLGDRSQAQDRYEMALDLDPTHIPDAGRPASDRDGQRRLGSRRALPRPRADLHRVPARPRQAARRARQAPRGDARRARVWPCRPTSSRCRATPTTRTRRCRSSTSTSRARTGPGPSRSPTCSRARAASAIAPSSTPAEHLGRVLAALGKDDGALKAYQNAHQLDLTDQETIRGLADVCFNLGDWAGALTNYQKVLTVARRGRDRGARDVYYKLGRIKRAQGRPSRPSTTSRRRSASTPRTARRSRRWSRSTRLKDYKQVCTYKRQILDNVSTAERFKMLNEIGRHLGRQSERPAEGGRGARGGARHRAAEPRAPAQAAAALPKDPQWAQMVDTCSASPTSRPTPSARAATSTRWRSSTATSSTTRAARWISSTRRSISTRRSSRPSSASTRSSPRRRSGSSSSGPTARCSTASRARGTRPRVQPLARARSHLPRPPRGRGDGPRDFKMASRPQARRRAGASDPRRALRSDGAVRRGDRRVPLDAQARSDEGRAVPEALQPLPGARRPTTRRGASRRARVPPQGGRRRAALLRGLQAARACSR